MNKDQPPPKPVHLVTKTEREANELNNAIAGCERTFDEYVKLINYQAKCFAVEYKAYKANGFTPDEALRLIVMRSKL